MISAENRAQRQSARFPGIDLPAIQKGVHENLLNLYLSLNGRYMDLLDLMNFVKDHRKPPVLTPGNVTQYYSLANTISHNGIYLYQYLSRAGFDPVLIQNYATANLEEHLKGNPLAVCISSNFIFMDEIKEMAQRIKQLAPRVHVIAGGMLVKKVLDPGKELAPQALQYLESFHGRVDEFVVEAQGEQSLVLLLNALESGTAIHRVPNVAFFDHDGHMVFSHRQREDLHMDQTAIPWDQIPREYLRSSLPVNSSRGCYYRCRFCTYHWLFPEVHYKSIEVLTQELRRIENLGFVRHVRFTDDNFTANRTRLEEVLRMIIQEGFRFTWSSFARASALTPDLVHLMKESGCEFVDMGIESGSQAILDNMDKKLKREQSLTAIRMLADHDIYARGSFIVGYPGETPGTFSETIDLIAESGLPYYHPYLFYYSPNTLIHQQREAFGLEGMGLAWKHSTMDAVEASYLMSQMVQKISTSYTDGITYIEEIYKLLRGEGYSPEAIWKLFQSKRDLQLAANGTSAGNPLSPLVDEKLNQLEALMK